MLYPVFYEEDLKTVAMRFLPNTKHSFLDWA
jgi:hypothetical protein